MRFRECEITKDFENLSGYYAKKGARGYITAVDGGYSWVLFTEESLSMIRSNEFRGNMLEVPNINLRVGEYKEVGDL